MFLLFVFFCGDVGVGGVLVVLVVGIGSTLSSSEEAEGLVKVLKLGSSSRACARRKDGFGLLYCKFRHRHRNKRCFIGVIMFSDFDGRSRKNASVNYFNTY